jgi:hypothetical protein
MNELIDNFNKTSFLHELPKYIRNDIDYLVHCYMNRNTGCVFELNDNVEQDNLFHLDHESYIQMVDYFKIKVLSQGEIPDDNLIFSYLDLFCEFMENAC